MDRDNLDIDLGQAILSTYDADGFLGIGIDVPGYEQSGTGVFDARFPYGTFSRPRDPDVSADQSSRLGAIVQFAFAGRDRHAWVLDDPRVTPKLPQAPKGTWGAYADTGRDEFPVLVLDGTTGSFALRVPHATGGVASRVLVNVETPGSEEIVLAHGAGVTAKVTLGPTGTDVTGSSSLTFPVTLYPPILPYLQEVLDTLTLLIAGDPLALPPVPGLGTLLAAVPGGAPLGTALVTQLLALTAASTTALNSAQASSAILRASTT